MRRPAPVVLEGNHVRLEPLSTGHRRALESAAEPDIFRYMPNGPFSPWGFDGYFDAALEAVASGQQVAFATVDRRSDTAIGSTRYADISTHDERLEIGFTWLARAWWRTAANTEAKLLLLRHAFEDLGAGRVLLKTDRRNERSRRAIERLGAREEGVLRRHMRMDDGTFRDTVMYSILSDEWPAVRGFLETRLEAQA
ncbi:MAG: family N-acetyltransferase [Acidimicrobiales bacterium]|nr:family N-acetyltransferase [Acidimicrobiales bacterium]